MNSVLFFTFNPAILPVNEVATFTVFTAASRSPSTFCTAYPRAFSSRLIPNAVTTTSSSSFVFSANRTVSEVLLPTGTSLVMYPIYEMIIELLVPTERLKLPLTSVIVPFPESFSLILAPIMGKPASSVTSPFIFLVVCCCAAVVSKICLGDRIILFSNIL